MPVGSAASLPLPQVPLSPSQRARDDRRGRFPDFRHRPATAPRFWPTHTAPEDPPRDRILMASTDAAAALEVERLLREAGYRLIGPAGSLAEVERLVQRPAMPRPAINCALVDLDLPDAAAVAERLAGEAVPLVWLTSHGAAVLPPHQSHAPVLPMPADRSALLAAIDTAMRQAGRAGFYPVPPPQPVWPRIFPSL